MTPSWASVSFGVVLCPQAAGVHRGLGTHVSRVLSLTLDKWELKDYVRMLASGNLHANLELEDSVPASINKPLADEDINLDSLDVWIRSKYQEKAFVKNGSGKLVTKSLRMHSLSGQENSGILVIRVKSARQLYRLDVTSESDPYVVAELGQQRFKTKRVKNDANPSWNEPLLLNVKNPNTDVVHLSVWDADTFSKDDLIGDCYIAIEDVLRQQGTNASNSAEPVVFKDQLLQGGDPASMCLREAFHESEGPWLPESGVHIQFLGVK
eukprot:CAMPEP_0197677084 /NCGR_PEP_ID=MMETSP1338-20131121/87825_1 /TAXON_ID=43686 ORGANISM="Pelagodinium beii, Strain RCC1491" /NCGR_SAMPLE_ID=MMETSP1338 /ASSEMBLY_ACC=CAM_ASM_000754 /LENGTH=266 /DNA_ID=CAMNT_0043257867 /DNA_START=91 /DNA_END=887 /DNA_ORIENTATION=-